MIARLPAGLPLTDEMIDALVIARQNIGGCLTPEEGMKLLRDLKFLPAEQDD